MRDLTIRDRGDCVRPRAVKAKESRFFGALKREFDAAAIRGRDGAGFVYLGFDADATQSADDALTFPRRNVFVAAVLHRTAAAGGKMWTGWCRGRVFDHSTGLDRAR